MEFKNKQAIYLQIAEYMRNHIVSGQWLPEEKIPSIRELAVTLAVNPNTTMRAYEYLQQQDIIYNKRGIGYFVKADAPKQILKLRKEQFLKNELPEFFKTVKLLDIDFEEIARLYKKEE